MNFCALASTPRRARGDPLAARGSTAGGRAGGPLLGQLGGEAEGELLHLGVAQPQPVIGVVPVTL
ncbi:MAG: hypothetical protein H6702_09220 [Myxococcales bacterium]|nr:hypothetical protein [Myxococcales bacterium]